MIALSHPQTPAMEAVLVKRNKALVYSIASRYKSCLGIEDLFTEGVCGLLKAARQFDPTRGCKFSTNATIWIRQNIGRAVEMSGVVRVPSHCHDAIRELERCYAAIGRDANDEEALLYLGWCSSKLANVRAAFSARHVLELDAPVGRNSKGEESSALMAFQAATGGDPAESVVEQLGKSEAWDLLKKLPPSQARIIERRMHGDTLQEIAQSMGLSRERIRQIERSGMCTLWRMREKLGSSLL